MANVAYLPIEADRYGTLVRQIFLKGFDATGVAMRAQVRLGGDVPGVPLVDLKTVSNANAEGLRLVSVSVTDGVPTSHVEMVINETTLEGLPYSGEIGSPTPLAWDWQVTLAGRKLRIAKGEFIITGDGVTGADNAPVDRPERWSTSGSFMTGMRTSATLTFGDTRIEVTIDGGELVSRAADAARAARDAALAAAAASDASAARSGLSAAAAASFVGGVLYSTTAAGLAATAPGGFFSVVGDALTYAVLYRKVDGAAVEVSRLASKALLDRFGVSPEMFGALPTYNPAVNDGPSIRLAQAASEALGVPLVFQRNRYAVWGTSRNSGEGQTGASGHWLTFGKGGVNWTSAVGRTTLSLFSRTGGDPSNDIQTVDGQPWRGHGLKAVNPYPAMTAPIIIDGITLDGQQADAGYTETADKWDTTNHGFSVLDTCWTEMRLTGFEVKNFRGEAVIYNVYGPNTVGATAYHTDCHYHSTTANAFNPGSMARTIAVGCRFGNAFSSECTMGPESSLTACKFYDTFSLYIVGGPFPDFPATYKYASRSLDSYPPWVDLAISTDNVFRCRLGNWVRGRIEATDTGFAIADTGKLECIQVEIHDTIDRRATDDDVAFELYGPPNMTTEFGEGMPAGTYVKPPANCRIALHLHQSDYARANGRRWQKPIRYNGLIDSSFKIIVSGVCRDYPAWANNAMSLPHIVDAGIQSDHTTGDKVNAPYTFLNAGAQDLQVVAPVMTIDASIGSAVQIGLPTAFPTIDGYTPLYAEGQEVMLLCLGNGRTFTIPASDPRHSLDADVVLDRANTFATFRYTYRQRWRLVAKGML